MFDSEILEILRNLDAAIKTFERKRRLTTEERRLLSLIKGVRAELAMKLAPALAR